MIDGIILIAAGLALSVWLIPEVVVVIVSSLLILGGVLRLLQDKKSEPVVSNAFGEVASYFLGKSYSFDSDKFKEGLSNAPTFQSFLSAFVANRKVVDESKAPDFNLSDALDDGEKWED